MREMPTDDRDQGGHNGMSINVRPAYTTHVSSDLLCCRRHHAIRRTCPVTYIQTRVGVWHDWDETYNGDTREPSFQLVGMGKDVRHERRKQPANHERWPATQGSSSSHSGASRDFHEVSPTRGTHAPHVYMHEERGPPLGSFIGRGVIRTTMQRVEVVQTVGDAVHRR